MKGPCFDVILTPDQILSDHMITRNLGTTDMQSRMYMQLESSSLTNLTHRPCDHCLQDVIIRCDALPQIVMQDRGGPVSRLSL